MPEALTIELKKLKIKNIADNVFINRHGTKISRYTLPKRAFATTIKRAGIKRIRFNDLRHTFATLMIAQGESMKFIQHQLGHSNISTTMDIYAHLLAYKNKEAVNTLAKSLL